MPAATTPTLRRASPARLLPAIGARLQRAHPSAPPVTVTAGVVVALVVVVLIVKVDVVALVDVVDLIVKVDVVALVVVVLTVKVDVVALVVVALTARLLDLAGSDVSSSRSLHISKDSGDSRKGSSSRVTRAHAQWSGQSSS